MDELSASIDVQQVYTKVIAKVTAVDVRHVHRATPTGAWQRGDFQGLLFTSCDLLTTNTSVTSGKTSRRRLTTPLSGPHPTEVLSEVTSDSAASHSFVHVTFTRALKRSVWRKLKLAECGSVIGRDASAAVYGTTAAFADVFLNEFSVKIQPFDAVLNCPALSPLLHIVKSTANLIPDQAPAKPAVTSSAPPVLSASGLPLLYLETSRMRLFVPRTDAKEEDDVKSGVPSQSADVLLFDCAGVSLRPHAENPLPRYDIKKRKSMFVA